MELLFYLIFIPIILVCITIHEFAHAKVADILGDPTPRLAGRLTLNPVSHIDPIGFLMLIIARIGWAKPVPINPYNFKNPETGMTLVGLAGPASNFFFAWILAIILKNVPFITGLWVEILSATIYVNLALMVFNLLPIPPLDGSRIYTQYLPHDWQFFLERYGFILLVFVILFPPTQMIMMRVVEFLYGLLM